MAIWDQTAAGTGTEIGRMWDQTAAGTSYELAKAWEQTTAGTLYEVWTAETQLYPGATPGIYTDYGAGGSAGSFYVSMASVGNNTNSRQAGIAINLSLYKTLTITSNITASGSTAYAGIVLHTSRNYAYYTVAHPTAGYYTQVRRTANSTLAGDWVINVAGYSGTYYLYCCCYYEGASSNSSSVSISKIVGVPV